MSTSVSRVCFSSLNGPSFCLVAEALDVDRHDLAAVRNVVDDSVLDERRRADALERPVVRAPRGQLVVDGLPQERAIRFLEGHQDALVALDRRVLHRFVVGADEHDAVGDDGIAVGLRAELGHPLDVLLGLDVPARRQVLHAGDEVAVRCAAPHRPVALAGIRAGDEAECADREEAKEEADGRHGAREHLGHDVWYPGANCEARPNLRGATRELHVTCSCKP